MTDLISSLADSILSLVNSKPQTPTKKELEDHIRVCLIGAMVDDKLERLAASDEVAKAFKYWSKPRPRTLAEIKERWDFSLSHFDFTPTEMEIIHSWVSCVRDHGPTPDLGRMEEDLAAKLGCESADEHGVHVHVWRSDIGRDEHGVFCARGSEWDTWDGKTPFCACGAFKPD